jgi:catechol 2,3-dioxygenase-like lactoylglutathione lyase family enzyme
LIAAASVPAASAGRSPRKGRAEGRWMWKITGGTQTDWEDPQRKDETMQLGAFSISLAVKDLGASRAFYEKLGFTQFGGDPEQNWLILKNGDTILGLFRGMFEKNMLTFNPGWDQNAQPVTPFTDVRELQRHLKAQGVTRFSAEADESTTGPASFILVDPDGNPVLVDQHV